MSTGRAVVQVLGPDGQALLTAPAANLRRWALQKLGPPAPRPAGRRPALDLRPLVRRLRYRPARSAFELRVLYERWLEPLVPLARRRDLKPPAYLHLDLAERFPRARVQAGPAVSLAQVHGMLYGPWRDARAAERALKALLKLFPLRPCDYVFEPHPRLALGLACLYAQVNSCAAPCLERTTEAAYRGLAQDAARWLAAPGKRPTEAQAWIPAWVAEARAASLVVEPGAKLLEFYPLVQGALREERAVRVPRPTGRQPGALGTAVERALEGLDWSPTATLARGDHAWLLAHCAARTASARWLAGPTGAGDAAFARRVVEACELPASRPG